MIHGTFVMHSVTAKALTACYPIVISTVVAEHRCDQEQDFIQMPGHRSREVHSLACPMAETEQRVIPSSRSVLTAAPEPSMRARKAVRKEVSEFPNFSTSPDGVGGSTELVVVTDVIPQDQGWCTRSGCKRRCCARIPRFGVHGASRAPVSTQADGPLSDVRMLKHGTDAK